MRVFSELQSGFLGEPLALCKERILVELLLELQLSQQLCSVASHDETGGVGSLLQLVERDVNVPLCGASQDGVR